MRIERLCVIVALCSWVSVAFAGPAYEPVTDPVPIVTRELVLSAPDHRDVPVVLRAPAEGDAPFPLIVFSHGAGGSGDAFAELSELLASHGYVVAHPTHSDSIKLRREQGERIRIRKELRTIVSKVDIQERCVDAQLVLDSIDELEESLDRPGVVDRERLAMAGHSAGAMTTQALAGAKFFAGNRFREATISEPRFDAFAVISGQGTEKRSLNEHSWEDIDRPMLVMAGSEDVSRVSDETPETRRHPYEYAPSDGTKYLVFIDGATHGSYQGAATSRILREEVPENIDWIVEVTNMSVLAFFDAYVKDDADAKVWLDSGDLADVPGGELEFLHK